MPDNTYTAKTRLLAPVPRSKRMRDANVTVAQQQSAQQPTADPTWTRDTDSVQGVEVLVPVAEPLVEVLRLRNGIHIVTISVDNRGYLHVDAGLYSDSFVSALGANPGGSSGSGSGGGGGIDITDLLNILNGTTDISEYTESKTIATAFLGNALTSITKAMVEAVLTGNITTHTHNQYQTVLTGLVTSHTHSTLALAHTNEINFTNTPTSGNLHNFWFNYRDGDTDAMNPNNLLTDYFFGNRNGVANARLNAGSMLLTSGAEVGGDILPTTALTRNLGAYSQSWNRIITRYIDTTSTYDLRVCTYGTERLHINASDGHVGIGTTSPTGMLHILQSAWSDGLVLQRSAANAGCGIRVLNSVGSQLGIFGINGSQQFELTVGSTTVCLWSASSLSVTGNILATGAVTALATSASDRRLKKDIKPFNARKIIDKLNPVQFYWNDEATEFNGFLPRKHLQHGLIAQDSDGIIDGFVFDIGNGTDYKGIHYEKLTPILLQSVKEQQAEIDSLKAEVAELKKIVNQLIEKRYGSII